MGFGIFFLLFVGFLLVPIGGMTLDVINNHPPGMVKNLVVFLVVVWLFPGCVIIMAARGLWEDRREIRLLFRRNRLRFKPGQKPKELFIDTPTLRVRIPLATVRRIMFVVGFDSRTRFRIEASHRSIEEVFDCWIGTVPQLAEELGVLLAHTEVIIDAGSGRRTVGRS